MSRVLIVNDSRFESMILNDILCQIGCNVRITDEYEALREVLSFSPDFVLVNYVMKETFGDKLIARIKASSANVKCILTSNSQVDSGRFTGSRIDAVIKTPINRHNLENVLNELDDNGNTLQEDSGIKNFKAKLESWKKKADAAQPVAAEAEKAEEKAGSYEFCPFCGHKLREKSSFAFCPYCGHKMS